jgi:hypothetical protein
VYFLRGSFDSARGEKEKRHQRIAGGAVTKPGEGLVKSIWSRRSRRQKQFAIRCQAGPQRRRKE